MSINFMLYFTILYSNVCINKTYKIILYDPSKKNAVKMLPSHIASEF